MTAVGHDDGVDELDLGRDPLSRSGSIGARLADRTTLRTRLLVGAAVLVVAAGVTTDVLLTRPARTTPTPVPAAAASPSVGFAAGPVLTEVGGRDELAVPGGAMFGGATMNIALGPADAAVAAVRKVVPSFADVRGGRVEDPAVHYGIYLTGTYTAAGGLPVQLTVYTARAPETPAAVAAFVRTATTAGTTTIRTELSVYTGTGWWVSAIASAPGADTARGDQTAVVRSVAVDPELVA